MRDFCDLYEQLDRTTGNTVRIGLLADFFAGADPADAAWGLQVLLAKRGRRLITGRRLRQICLDGCGLPDWLFEACHAQVGDSAETIALLWPPDPVPAAPSPDPATARCSAAVAADPGAPICAVDHSSQALDAAPPHTHQPLHVWMEELLPAAAALEGEAQAEAVRGLWRGLEPRELLVVNKLLSGGLRVGVAQGLVVRALTRLSGLEDALLRHRLMGEFRPTASAWRALLAPPEDDRAVPSRPYPFFLASPLQADPAEEAPLGGAPSDWLVEWKWDGIRAQLLHREGGTFLWSRGEELIHASFPEVMDAANALPCGTVLDGELLVWPPGDPRPAPFAALQRRLGRSRPGRGLLQECPAVLVAYDLLEWRGEDIRAWPLNRRRDALEALFHADPVATPERGAGVLRLSPRLPLDTWSELEALRQRAERAGAEGLMLKHSDSAYQSGRRRGAWWKHKRDPYRLDAVLLYAQAGSGRRANLFTDYTFGLWDRPLASRIPSPEGSEHDSPEALSSENSALLDGLPPETKPSAHHESEAQPRQEVAAERRLITFAKAYSGLDDGEILALDRWIRSHTTERFGPVRAVEPLQVFELAFEGLQRSGRHKSGVAVRFPRISRWRRDKLAAEADSLETALELLERQPEGCSEAPLDASTEGSTTPGGSRSEGATPKPKRSPRDTGPPIT